MIWLCAAWIGRLSAVFDFVWNMTHSTSPSVNCHSWLLTEFGIEIGHEKVYNWCKKDFQFSFPTESCVELTSAETCFITCFGSYFQVNIRLMLASFNQIYVCWILFPSVFIYFAGEWAYGKRHRSEQAVFNVFYLTPFWGYSIFLPRVDLLMKLIEQEGPKKNYTKEDSNR